MRIAVSANGKNLEDQLDSRFGRAAWFLIIDSSTMKYSSFHNPNIDAAGGAGTQSAQFVLEKGAETVITGRCGPNAFRVLKTARIPVFEAKNGTIREILQQWKDGKLTEITESSLVQGKKHRSHQIDSDYNSTHSPSGNGAPQNQGPTKQAISGTENRLNELNRRLTQLKKQKS